MLTTADKLRSTERDELFDPSLNQAMDNFNFNELFETTRPSKYLMSVYSNNSVKEEKQKSNNEEPINDEKYLFSMGMYYLVFYLKVIYNNNLPIIYNMYTIC